MEDKFGDRLKQFRLTTGLSAAKFAVECGVGNSAQSTYEQSIRYPDTKYWQHVAKLGGDIGYIISGDIEFAKIDESKLKESISHMLTTAMQLDWVVFKKEIKSDYLFALCLGEYKGISLDSLLSKFQVSDKVYKADQDANS